MRKLVGALALSAILIVTAAVPLATYAGEYVVERGPQGPKSGMVNWTYTASTHLEWGATVENHGLRWLVIEVYDTSVGSPTIISHQRIGFAAQDAYPTGTVDSASVLMAAGRTYEIFAIPSGPKGTYAVITEHEHNEPPVAMFTHSVSGDTVSVDASGSSDDHGIVEYRWEWGDGLTNSSSSPTATHTYFRNPDYGGPPFSVQLSDLPSMPFPLFGNVYAPDGSPAAGALIKVVNERTGAHLWAWSDSTGLYMVELNFMVGNINGDVMNITAILGGIAGYAEAVCDFLQPYLTVDLHLSNDFTAPPLEFNVTLTVYDAMGQSASITEKVTFNI